MIFKTQRCLIRKMQSDDFDGLFELHRDPEVMRYTSGDPQNKEACKEDLLHVISQYEIDGTYLLVYTIENEHGEFIGTCAILRNDLNELEIGYRLSKRYWGNGYATEVTNGLVVYCRQTFDIEELFAYCFVANAGSVKVLEKCGFTLIKEFMNEEDGLLDRKYSIIFSSLNSSSNL